MKSEEFDRAFDDGEDVTTELDVSAARRPGLEQRRVDDRVAGPGGAAPWGEPPVDHQGLDRRASGARRFASVRNPLHERIARIALAASMITVSA
jgi:hypothetical protein